MSKAADSCVRAEASLWLFVLHQLVDKSRLSAAQAAAFANGMEKLVIAFKRASNRASLEHLIPSSAEETLPDFVFEAKTGLCDDDGRVGDDKDEESDDVNGEGGNSGTEDGNDANEFKGGATGCSYLDDEDQDDELGLLLSSGEVDGGTSEQIWAALHRTGSSKVGCDEQGQDLALSNLAKLFQSLVAQHGDKFGCEMMGFGLSTLGLFPPRLTAADFVRALSQWTDYSRDCEEMRALRPPPPGPLSGDKWVADEGSEHLKRSACVGLNPFNLYAALLVMLCKP